MQRGSSHNINSDMPPVTDEHRSNRGVEANGQGTSVLNMIYERDAIANSKESRKNRDPQQRHSFLDEVASENGAGADSESIADSDRKRSST